MTTNFNPEISLEKVNKVAFAILGLMGEPKTELHDQALRAFASGEHQLVKRLAATHLSDHYCKSLAYLGGALKLTPNTDTILAESARAAADFVKEQALMSLGLMIEQALNED